jgi:predicted Fe-Mo cluster-binding NifX family protein
VTGASGTVKEAIERYKKNELKEINDPTVDGRFGIGKGRGRR